MNSSFQLYTYVLLEFVLEVTVFLKTRFNQALAFYEVVLIFQKKMTHQKPDCLFQLIPRRTTTRHTGL